MADNGFFALLQSLAGPIGAGLTNFAGAVVPSFKEKRLVNDAIAKERAEFAGKKERENLDALDRSGSPLPKSLSRLSQEQETQKLEKFSAKMGVAVAESEIRQQAQHEVKIDFIQQLMQEAFSAFQVENYETVLAFSRLLQPLLAETSVSYATLDEMYILSLVRLARPEASTDTRRAHYTTATELIEKYHNNFFITFEYGHTSLFMLPCACSKEERREFIQTAIDCFTTAVTLDENSDIALNNLAVSLRYSVEYSENEPEKIAILERTVALLEKAKAIAPDNYKAHGNLGESYAQLAASPTDSPEQQYQYRELASQSFSTSVSLQANFSSLMQYADALCELAKLEQDKSKKDTLLQQAVRTYNDAQNIAPSRGAAGFACLRIADAHDYARHTLVLEQRTRDSLIFQIVMQLRLAVEFFPFDGTTQFKTAMLIFYITKYGEQHIPLFKNELKPLVSAHNKKAKHTLMAEMLASNARYVRDAIALKAESPNALARLVEANVYWGLLQKKIGNTQKMNDEYTQVTSVLDKADAIKLYSASYTRACMFGAQGDEAGCQCKLKEAITNGLCPPRDTFKAEPYFESYHKRQWFKDILASLPEQTTPPDYFSLASLEAGATA